MEFISDHFYQGLHHLRIRCRSPEGRKEMTYFCVFFLISLQFEIHDYINTNVLCIGTALWTITKVFSTLHTIVSSSLILLPSFTLATIDLVMSYNPVSSGYPCSNIFAFVLSHYILQVRSSHVYTIPLIKYTQVYLLQVAVQFIISSFLRAA